jgi:hypothetical protein
MKLQDIMAPAAAKKAGSVGRIGLGCAAPALPAEWQTRGWTTKEFDSMAAAADAAIKHEIDLLLCATTDSLGTARMLMHTGPKEWQPVVMLHGVDVPAFPRTLWFGGIPSGRYDVLAESVKQLQTMIKALNGWGYGEPKVALLSCVEMVSPGVPSTVWEATLGQMSQRGQFGKAKVDGPLAFDLAVSQHAVEEKNLKSDVGAVADLLVPPDLNSFGSLLDAIHLTGAHETAEILAGGPCPVALVRACSSDHASFSLAAAALLMP